MVWLHVILYVWKFKTVSCDINYNTFNNIYCVVLLCQINNFEHVDYKLLEYRRRRLIFYNFFFTFVFAKRKEKSSWERVYANWNLQMYEWNRKEKKCVSEIIKSHRFLLFMAFCFQLKCIPFHYNWYCTRSLFIYYYTFVRWFLQANTRRGV